MVIEPLSHVRPLSKLDLELVVHFVFIQFNVPYPGSQITVIYRIPVFCYFLFNVAFVICCDCCLPAVHSINNLIVITGQFTFVGFIWSRSILTDDIYLYIYKYKYYIFLKSCDVRNILWFSTYPCFTPVQKKTVAEVFRFACDSWCWTVNIEKQ